MSYPNQMQPNLFEDDPNFAQTLQARLDDSGHGSARAGQQRSMPAPAPARPGVIRSRPRVPSSGPRPNQTFTGTRARVMTAAAEGVTITMVGDPQVQARLFGIAPHQIDRPEASVGKTGSVPGSASAQAPG